MSTTGSVISQSSLMAALIGLWLVFSGAVPCTPNPECYEVESQERIILAIKAKFLRDNMLGGQSVDVHYHAGTVVLTGRVDSPAAKERAADLARRAEGVAWVVNRLVIDEPITSDRLIERRVQTRVARTPGLNALCIDARAHNGIVTLTGRAASFQQKDLAERITRSVDGVSAILNDIHVPLRPDCR